MKDIVMKFVLNIKNRISGFFEDFNNDDRGIGVVEVVLILVVLIGLVVIFRDQLTTIINGIFTRITNDTNAL